MNLLNSFHASALDSSEIAYEADASSRFLQMRPPETTQRQRLKRMQLPNYFIVVRRGTQLSSLSVRSDPVSIENMLPASQPDYNLPLVSCRLIFPGMRS